MKSENLSPGPQNKIKQKINNCWPFLARTSTDKISKDHNFHF